MPSFTNAYITTVGQASITAAIAGTNLQITRVAVGSGIMGGDPTTLTALVNQTMNLTPLPPQVSANVIAPDEVAVLATLDSANAPPTSFNLNEIGVFGKSGGGAEQLIAYYQCVIPGDTITQQTGLSRLQIYFSLPIYVGIGANVTITVVAGNPIFIPPVVAGTGITVTAPTDSHGNVLQWIVATKTITNNTTLFVNPTYNNVAPNFSSINNAMNYLRSFSISSGIGVLISVAAGTYTGGQTTIVHANASQITITGPQNGDISFTGVGTITGSAGNWNVPLTGCSSTANVAVNGYISLWGAVSLNPIATALLCGFHKVVAVSGSTVTVNIPYYKTSWPSLAGAPGGWFTPITAILSITQAAGGTWGFSTDTHGIGTLQYIGIIPASAIPANTQVAGLNVGGPGYLNHIGVRGFTNNTGTCVGIGISGGSGYVTINRSSATLCDWGIVCSGSSVAACMWCASTHNIGLNYWSQSANMVFQLDNISNQDANCISAGSRSTGVQGGGNGILTCQAGWAGGALRHGRIYSVYNAGVGFNISNSITNASTANDFLYGQFNDSALDLTVSAMGISYCQLNGSRLLNQAEGVLTANGLILNAH